VLANKLDAINLPAKITNPEHFKTALAALTQVIANMVEEKVPQLTPSPYAKCWWTKELGLEKKEVHKLGRQAHNKTAQRNHPIHEEYRVARNRFSKHIKKAKEDHWTQWLDTLTSTGMWNFHRYATSNLTEQIHTCIQTLQDQQCEQTNNQMQDNTQKSKILYETFFRPPPENNFVDPNYTVSNKTVAMFA
jgi:hypothetical protein